MVEVVCWGCKCESECERERKVKGRSGEEVEQGVQRAITKEKGAREWYM